MRGFVNIDKPKGMTSSDVVVIVRGILRRATSQKHKVGHLGTLDPQGTGVLPIAVGSATRLFDYLQDKTKIYQATFVFGKTTDTLDSDGVVTESSNILPTIEQIDDVLPKLCGDIDQIPPMYSAKSVGGQRAYDLARKGIEVELKSKRVRIDDIKRIDDGNGIAHLQNGDKKLDKNEHAFEIVCSGGTYIRSIARDMANALGSVAYMSSIRRIKNGAFDISVSVTLEEFEKDPIRYLKSIEECLPDFPRFDLPENLISKVINGVQVQCECPKGYFLTFAQGEILGIGECVDGKLKMRVRL